MQRTPARLFDITSKITVDEVAAKSGTEWKKGINNAVPNLRAKVSTIYHGHKHNLTDFHLKYPRAATALFKYNHPLYPMAPD